MLSTDPRKYGRIRRPYLRSAVLSRVRPLVGGRDWHRDLRRRAGQANLRPVVAVAMSGGVDSSVAAALCVAQGFEVVGIMLRLWSEPGAAGANKCCTLGAMDDARAVADRLDIPFSIVDATEEFKRVVVDEFVGRAAAGDTPNPCFGCNRRMRFGFLLDRARAVGADFLATGHYARVTTLDEMKLLAGVDELKDQSYMLHRLDQASLARAVFPLGEYTKPEVRSLAAEFGLAVAAKHDSVDLCWVGKEGVAGFLRRSLAGAAMAPGPIVDASGREIGQHRGLPGYTLGQRRGLGVSTGEPVFVTRRDFEHNVLVVGPAADLLTQRTAGHSVHWISGRAPDGPQRVGAKIRYGARAAPAVVTPGPGDTVAVLFDEPQRAPTPGQGVVFYQGDEVLGGAVIARPGV